MGSNGGNIFHGVKISGEINSGWKYAVCMPIGSDWDVLCCTCAVQWRGGLRYFEVDLCTGMKMA